MSLRLRTLAPAATAAFALTAAMVVGPVGTGTARAGDTFLVLPEPALPGANDLACKPTADKPNPVVLVQGFGATATENWWFFAPHLAEAGYCVYARTFGVDPRYPGRGGVRSMEASAVELADFVEAVLQNTGAAKVDIVGHSRGAVMPRHYLKFLGGHRKVERFVGWAGPNHGTDINGITHLRSYYPAWDGEMVKFCASCVEFMPESDFMRALNEPTETVGQVRYTVLVTRYDLLVTPMETSFLEGANVENIVIQDVAPTLAGHAEMAMDPTTFALTLDALQS